MTNPLWTPDFTKHRPLIADFIGMINQRHSLSIAETDFGALHDWSIKNLSDFWNAVWDFSELIGDKGDTVLKSLDDAPYARFYPNGCLSYTENMLKPWLQNPEKTAIIYRHQDSADRIISGKQLCESVSLWEQALRRAGIGKDDVVGVYLSNVPETDFILLAASNIGAVFCSAGMEMGGDDLLGRFGAVKPKIIITANGYLHGDKIIDRSDILAKAQTTLPNLEKIIRIPIAGSTQDDGFLDGLSPQALTFTRHDFNQPLYILFSSGTTGVPKCFVHSSGGVLLKHMCEYKLQADVQAGDRAFYHATPSWMMWNWGSSALAAAATNLKYDGNPFYPDAIAQLKFTSDHGCTHHGTAAPVIMGWRDQNLNVADKLDLSALRTIMYTGAVLPDIGFDYINTHIKSGVQIAGISGGTDLVGCFLSGNPLMPTVAGQIPAPVLGIDMHVWDEDGKPLETGKAGELVCANAFPFMPLYFLNDTDGSKYRDAYYDFYGDKGTPKIWRHGDTIFQTTEGQYVIVGRSDGTLNQNGVRIGTGTIYAQLDPFRAQIKSSCAVDFIRPDTKQAITILFLHLADEADTIPADLAKAIKSAVKNNVGPYSVPTEIIAVPGVLRTKNGKLAEVVTKKILAGSTIPNPELYGADLVKFYETVSQDLRSRYSTKPRNDLAVEIK